MFGWNSPIAASTVPTNRELRTMMDDLTDYVGSGIDEGRVSNGEKRMSRKKIKISEL